MLLVIAVYHRQVVSNIHEQLSGNRQMINDHPVFHLFPDKQKENGIIRNLFKGFNS
jgi:hypothetical protein